ncbi:MAG: hypothetical protein NVS2B12_13020 [Ktedonobacteraceae bacterium]
MQLRSTDLIAALVVIALNVLCVELPETPPWIRTIAALPLVFVLPGYVLTEALFYQRKIAFSHRLVLILGLSIVIVITGGLLLNVFAPGLQRTAWLLYLSLFTLPLILIAVMRRGMPVRRGISIKHLHMYEYLLFGVAVCGVIFALWYASEGVVQQPHSGFTQLWMLPAGDNGCAVRLGVRNLEQAPVAYRLSITANATPVATQFPATLKASEQVERTINLPAPIQSGAVDVQAQLYRLDKQGEVYRSVNIVVNRQAPYCT